MIVFSGDLDKALAAFIIATGATAMGKEAVMFFTFWGTPILRDLKKKGRHLELYKASFVQGIKNLENVAFREETGKAKVNQIRETGAAIVATGCENCHTQLNFLNDRYKSGLKVEFLTNLVANSLVLE
jgi:peroxiredoxin family protein